jgi:3,5-epimerase/4-reductase
MKFLLFGGRGWIGNMIKEELEKNPSNVVILANHKIDEYDELRRYLSLISPDRIICSIGRTRGGCVNSIDYLEDHLYENVHDNLYSPLLLMMLCDSMKIHLTCIGTGCIFNYEDEKKEFTESDKPNFFGSGYSIVKGFTDRLSKIFSNVLNLRIRMPISSKQDDREFITKIMKYKNICSIENSMTILDEFIPLLVKMSLNRETGTFNFTNPGTISHVEILDMMGRDKNDYQLVSYEEQRKLLKSDRSNNELNVDKLIEKYGPIDDIKVGIRKVIEKRLLRV